LPARNVAFLDTRGSIDPRLIPDDRSTTTAGGLTFVGRNDGRLMALDSASGAKLWEFQTGAGMTAPVSVFVVAYSAGNLFAGSPKGDSVWLESLREHWRNCYAGSTLRRRRLHPKTRPLRITDPSATTSVFSIGRRGPQAVVARRHAPCS
jgi:outer membrane protein assembly factor BamB